MHSVDQCGDTIEFSYPPRRIISLVPSQTEFFFDIGLDQEITGVTRFCIHPAGRVKDKPKIGGTKQFDIEKIKSLNPELIIGNKEENYLEGIEKLKEYFPVWMSDIYTLEDAYYMMKEVSRITDRCAKGEEAVNSIRNAFNNFFSQRKAIALSAAYFIWRKPYMVVASNTFIDHMMNVLGVKNIFSHLQRYPEIEPEVLNDFKPDLIFLSSEPYAFLEKHVDEFQSFSPGSKVQLVDGEMFSWYGTRLNLVPEYFKKLSSEIHF
jgi:ABC-type Fe3+-hydroxamate transport system substrate-binding protein